MIDMLFREIGAVVTSITGQGRCVVEPFCDPEKVPTYSAENGFEVDFELLLDCILAYREPSDTVESAARRVLFDKLASHRSAQIGPSWPGGVYEGVVAVREDLLQSNATLAAAAAALPGQPWEYQLVASIDEETGEVRRYHGFYADVVREDGDALELAVAIAGKSQEPSSPRKGIRYDPKDTWNFYSGPLVAENLVRSGGTRRKSGAVFIATDAFDAFESSLPKLPPSLGE